MVLPRVFVFLRPSSICVLVVSRVSVCVVVGCQLSAVGCRCWDGFFSDNRCRVEGSEKRKSKSVKGGTLKLYETIVMWVYLWRPSFCAISLLCVVAS